MFQEVLRRAHLSAPEDLGRVIAEEARRIGVDSLVIYVVDYEQRTLVPVPAPDAHEDGPLSIGGTVAGRAFANTAIIDVEGDAGEGRRLWLPLLDGTERIGVLRLAIAGEAPVNERLVAACERYAHFIALLVVSKSAYTDLFELLRRTAPMTLASELVWELVPPLVLASEEFVLSALLEPCYDIGGDAFDYALDCGVLHFAVFDAMGHGLPPPAWPAARSPRTATAAATGTVLRRPTRLSMRRSRSKRILTSRFVTALIAELDLATGDLLWVSAGHPAPLLLRDGRLVKTLDVAPSPPLALALATGPPTERRESLSPGT